MKVYCYNVGCGDSFRIEFTGISGKIRNILIDTGFERSFRDILADELSTIESRNQHIDLCIISHIHADHIGGAKILVNGILLGRINDIVLQWWYNCPRIISADLKPRKAQSSGIAQSINQADILTGFLHSKNALPTGPIIQNSNPYILDGMEIIVLSPDQQNLNRFKEKYSDSKIAIESLENEKYSKAVAAVGRDYYKSVQDFSITDWKEDQNVENGSSIALLTMFGGKKVLWLADAFPSVIVSSLKELGYSPDNPLTCDYVKVSHHGSLGNNSAELYEMIKCQNYIISSDGYNLYGLPSKACLLQILKSSKRNLADQYKFYLTANDPILQSIFAIDGEEVFQLLNFEIIYPIGNKGFVIEF